MNEVDKLKVYDLCLESKFGKVLTQKQMIFLSKMWEEYPDDYKEISKKVREEAMKRMNPKA